MTKEVSSNLRILSPHALVSLAISLKRHSFPADLIRYGLKRNPFKAFY